MHHAAPATAASAPQTTPRRGSPTAVIAPLTNPAAFGKLRRCATSSPCPDPHRRLWWSQATTTHQRPPPCRRRQFRRQPPAGLPAAPQDHRIHGIDVSKFRQRSIGNRAGQWRQLCFHQGDRGRRSDRSTVQPTPQGAARLRSRAALITSSTTAAPPSSKPAGSSPKPAQPRCPAPVLGAMTPTSDCRVRQPRTHSRRGAPSARCNRITASADRLHCHRLLRRQPDVARAGADFWLRSVAATSDLMRAALDVLAIQRHRPSPRHHWRLISTPSQATLATGTHGSPPASANPTAPLNSSKFYHPSASSRSAISIVSKYPTGLG